MLMLVTTNIHLKTERDMTNIVESAGLKFRIDSQKYVSKTGLLDYQACFATTKKIYDLN